MIRPFRAEDQTAVQEVIKSVCDDYGFTWDPDDYHADLWDIENTYVHRGGFWVAEHEGKVVGTIGLTLFPTVPGTIGEVVEVEGTKRIGGADCEFCRLYVIKEARGLKLGRRLAETIIEAAQRRGCCAMEIWSDKLFVEAHALYAKLGAKIVGERICDDPDEAPEWGMVLPL